MNRRHFLASVSATAAAGLVEVNAAEQGKSDGVVSLSGKDENDLRAIIDYFHPQTLNGKRNLLPKIEGVDDSRRFYECWFQRTYIIRDTVILTGKEADSLKSAIETSTDKKEAGGLSGHFPRYAVTIFSKSETKLVATFCFLSQTWVRKEEGKGIRGILHVSKDLGVELSRLDPLNAKLIASGAPPPVPLKNDPR